MPQLSQRHPVIKDQDDTLNPAYNGPQDLARLTVVVSSLTGQVRALSPVLMHFSEPRSELRAGAGTAVSLASRTGSGTPRELPAYLLNNK